jgi:23S rRNA (uracil1939-C5)-methyltransferase
VKKGEMVTLRIDSAAYEGKGIGKFDGLAVFVGGTAPGDLVSVRITKKKSSFAEATLLEVLEPGPDRIPTRCRHADVCGGCTWQHVTYASQTAFKRDQIRDHLVRIGGLKDVDVRPTLACDNAFHYRNKMEYTFAERRWLTQAEVDSDDVIDNSTLALGLHIPGRYDKILNLDECHLQIPESFAMLEWLRSYAIHNHIPAYNSHSRSGVLRNLMVRNGQHTGDLMVNLVTFTDNDDILLPLKDAMLAAFPSITTFVVNVNDTQSPTSVGRYERVLFGPGHITETLGAHTYRIGPNAFFQTNTPQAERLYATAKEFAQIRPTDTVYDLYCGVGSISLFVSDAAKTVVGVELNETAIANARKNASENGVGNVFFEQGDMKDVFSDDLIARYGKPDVLITDPPRAGMHEDVVRRLIALRIPRIVYVSCNSATLARDLALMSDTYKTLSVQPVDMFPHTYHIECVAVCELL